MQKIETIYKRNPRNQKRVINERNDRDDRRLDVIWSGDAFATGKWDGTACMIYGGKLYRRHQLSGESPKPSGWVHWTLDHAAPSGHGWLAVTDAPTDRYHIEGFDWLTQSYGTPEDGTYELIGPKINGNPHRAMCHQLVPHGKDLVVCGFGFDELASTLGNIPFEGIVWWGPYQGSVQPLGKIKAMDFGLDWKKNLVSR